VNFSSEVELLRKVLFYPSLNSSKLGQIEFLGFAAVFRLYAAFNTR